MAYPTIENLTAAANFLVTSNRFTRLANEIDAFIRGWDTTPKQYAGELAILNPMIRLGVDHPEKYAKLMAKINAARKHQADTRRTDYQRDLMRRKRKRETDAIALAEWTRGKRFTSEQRERELHEVKRRWDEERVKFVTRHAKDSSETRDATATFWRMVDLTLEQQLADIRASAEPPAPPSRKKVATKTQLADIRESAEPPAPPSRKKVATKTQKEERV